VKPPNGLATSLYRGMVEIREFELKAKEIFRSGKMPGFIHVYVGEEAIAVGVCANLRTDDYVASTHRGHGHALAK
jgi:pyruvate dehydrogenase E1 component alpha subunit